MFGDDERADGRPAPLDASARLTLVSLGLPCIDYVLGMLLMAIAPMLFLHMWFYYAAVFGLPVFAFVLIGVVVGRGTRFSPVSLVVFHGSVVLTALLNRWAFHSAWASV